MPVTIKPADHASTVFKGNGYKLVHSAEVLLLETLSDDNGDGPSGPTPLVQSSFAAELASTKDHSSVYATKNGFVHACLEAYSAHHRLVLRPEDIWFAILTQLSAYIHGRAEELRSQFVGYGDGEKLELHVEAQLGDKTDHGALAFQMGKLVQGAIKDEGLRDWVLPTFTTTTKVDQAVASMLLMGTMQKYFTFSWGTRCGLPAVTLLGSAGDWAAVRARAERLARYGEEPARWLRLLRPVLDGFVASFAAPESGDTLRFWRRVCDEHRPNGSGRTTYSGWITAFCFWDEKGVAGEGGGGGGGVQLARNQIPIGFSKVPVNLFYDGVCVPSEIIAGSVGIKASREKVATGNDRRAPGFDTIQPLSGWSLYHKPSFEKVSDTA
ncbi:hypothetical protein F5Y19DRAFT_461393 [Xylariaceae sp. FL1651]|nr:hypothetical protein F5Y19DRAFT_461393 [Xylariaceae sp. FL1651]